MREEWGECIYGEIFVEPAVEVVDVLASYDDLEEMWRYLPESLLDNG